MNWDQIKSNWGVVSGEIKRIWGKLSEADIVGYAGQRDQLACMLDKRYGYAAVVAQNKVDEFAQRLKR